MRVVRTRMPTSPMSGVLRACAIAALAGLVASGSARADDPPGEVAPRYAFLVGAASYLYGSQVGLADLKYADDDAVAFGEALVGLGWAKENVDVLVQGRPSGTLAGRVVAPPTREGVLARWKAFCERVRAEARTSGTRAEGVVLLLSGHGVEFKGQPKGGLKVENTYFVPVDAEQMTAEALVDVQPMLEELQGLPVNRRWFVYDACRKSVEAASRDYAASSTMLQRLKVPQGTWLMLSCESGQASYEARQLGHGVFLHHLVEGMRGGAFNPRGELTLTSLADFASSATRQWVAENLGGEEQLPVLKSEGTTWVLAQRARTPATPAPAPLSPVTAEPAWARDVVSEAQRSEARRLGVPAAVEDEKTGVRYVLIPRGTFTMGSPDDETGRSADEGPQRRVTIEPFYLALTETTNAQFERFVAATGHRTTAEVEGKGYVLNPEKGWEEQPGVSWRAPLMGGGRPSNWASHPVVLVSWDDATAYARWAGSGSRLSSEAEFEYVLRGGGGGTKYPWGQTDVPPTRAGNYAGDEVSRAFPKWPYETIKGYDDGAAGTAPVGSFTANPFGLLDVSGNVWEWCDDDRHDTYAGAPTDGRAWIDSPRAAQRVIRGGSWFLPARLLASATRTWSEPSRRGGYLGFRLARAVTP
jgi:formylglycine-generating enzyme required for sulfatase activity